jgi:hypothetical protein
MVVLKFPYLMMKNSDFESIIKVRTGFDYIGQIYVRSRNHNSS